MRAPERGLMAAPPAPAVIEQWSTPPAQPSGPFQPANLAGGTVTLLFTDLEGSTHLLQQLGAAYATVLAEMREILRAVFKHWNGQEVDNHGDAMFAAFARASQAVNAAAQAQRDL